MSSIPHSISYVPILPFPDFKWKWASLQCTESINDPIVLLGVLYRMRKLEILDQGFKYSSPEFTNELRELSHDIKDSIGVDLAGRGGSRNLIRNSGQYWKATGLIKSDSHSGLIQLTNFGRKVADHEISQTEFAAYTISHFTLPNPTIQNDNEIKLWRDSGLKIRPLLLILQILLELKKRNVSRGISTEDIASIIVPLSSQKAALNDYIFFLEEYWNDKIDILKWPNCAKRSNDKRVLREFLLFLSNYGFINESICSSKNRFDDQYILNPLIIDEIAALVNRAIANHDLIADDEEITSEVERKRAKGRPNQANFRRLVLQACERCVITNATMPEILEAAHIKPYKYNGEDTAANGFAMRTDIHILFDTGHLRISPEGNVVLTNRARLDYGTIIPPRIVIPSFTNLDFVRWRWENYSGY